MSDPENTAPDNVTDITTFLPPETAVKLGDETVVIETFKFGKTLRVLEVLSTIVDRIDVPEALVAKDQNEVILNLVSLLPRIFSETRDDLLKLLATICVSEERFRALKREGVPEQVEIDRYTELIEDADTETVMDILILGVKAVGVDALAKKFRHLLGAFRG